MEEVPFVPEPRRTFVSLGSALVATLAALGILVACGREGAPPPHEAASPPRLPCDPSRGIKLAEPKRGLYAGAWVGRFGFDGRMVGADYLRREIPRFAREAGKRPALVVTLDVWLKGRIRFPAEQVKAIWESGAVPRVVMLSLSDWRYQGKADPVFSNQRIIDGRFDRELTSWARAARRSGIPLMVTWGHEVNIGWSWSGDFNGAGNTTGYGDPALPDGPERYRDAYRHIVDVFRAAGARNVTWSFQVAPFTPEEADRDWNAIANYYPGDAYIDWIGISVYGLLPPFQNEELPLAKIMDAWYPKLAALSSSRPIAIFELGVHEDPAKGDKPKWIRDGLRQLRTQRWPRVKLMTWWNDPPYEQPGVGTVDTTIGSSTAARRAYRNAIAAPEFKARPRFRCSR